MSDHHKRARGSPPAEEYEAPDIDEDDEAAEVGEPSNKKSKMTQIDDDDDDAAAMEGNGYQPTIDLSIGGDAAWRRPPVADINPVTDRLSQNTMDWRWKRDTIARCE